MSRRVDLARTRRERVCATTTSMRTAATVICSSVRVCSACPAYVIAAAVAPPGGSMNLGARACVHFFPIAAVDEVINDRAHFNHMHIICVMSAHDDSRYIVCCVTAHSVRPENGNEGSATPACACPSRSRPPVPGRVRRAYVTCDWRKREVLRCFGCLCCCLSHCSDT